MGTERTWFFEESPLYGIKSKKQLSYILRTPLKSLKSLRGECNYTPKIGKRGRRIQDPKPRLKNVQKKVLACLIQIPPPDWLYSSYKKRSYYQNAYHHVATSNYILTMDIMHFFPSCRQQCVFEFFRDSLHIVSDVAWLLSEITTYRNFLPTGSPSSQILAFWSYWSTFFHIQEFAEKNGCNMSLFVDDMAFSSNKPFPKQFSRQVKKILNKVGLDVKREKTKYLGSGKDKNITGVSIPRGQYKIRIQNSKRLDIINVLHEWDKTPKDKNLTITRKAYGMLSSARQIEPNFMENTIKKLKPWLKKKNRI